MMRRIGIVIRQPIGRLGSTHRMEVCAWRFWPGTWRVVSLASWRRAGGYTVSAGLQCALCIFVLLLFVCGFTVVVWQYSRSYPCVSVASVYAYCWLFSLNFHMSIHDRLSSPACQMAARCFHGSLMLSLPMFSPHCSRFLRRGSAVHAVRQPASEQQTAPGLPVH